MFVVPAYCDSSQASMPSASLESYGRIFLLLIADVSIRLLIRVGLYLNNGDSAFWLIVSHFLSSILWR